MHAAFCVDALWCPRHEAATSQFLLMLETHQQEPQHSQIDDDEEILR